MLITLGEMWMRRRIVVIAMCAAGRRHENGFNQRQDRSVVAHGVRHIAWFGKWRDRQKRYADAVLIEIGAGRRERPRRIESELRAQISGIIRRRVRCA